MVVFVYMRSIFVTPRVMGKEAAMVAGGFLESNKNFGDFSCDGRSCQASEKITPHYAWRTMALSALYSASSSPKSLELVKEEFRNYRSNYKNNENFATLWQIYTAYKATGDPEMLSHFIESMLRVGTFFMFDPLSEKFLQSTAMNLSTIAREFLLAAEAYADPETIRILESANLERPLHKTIRLRDWPAQFKEQAMRLVEAARAAEKRDPLMVEWDSKIHMESCWLQFANSARFLTMQDKDALGEVKDFFRRVAFSSHSRDDYKIETLQTVLPCIQVLKELKSVFPDLERDYRVVVERFLIHNFDSSKRARCDGDGAFLVLVKQEYDSQCKDVKSTADISWAISLLAGDENEYMLRR